MNVEVQRQDGNLIALVEGSVDGNNAAAFQASLQDAVEEGDKSMVLDFGALDYISSAGLRVLLLVAKDMQNKWRKLCNLLPPGAGQGAFLGQRLRSDHPDQRLRRRRHEFLHPATSKPGFSLVIPAPEPESEAWKCIPSPLMGRRC